MSTISMDFTANLKVYPYVAPKPTLTVPSSVPSKTELISAEEQITEALQNAISQANLLAQNIGSGTTTGADQWKPLQPFFPEAVEKFTSFISGKLKALGKATDFLNAVLKILQLFIGTISSYSAVASAIFALAKQTVNKMLDSSMNMGVYVNLIVPPAFLKKSTYSLEDFQKSQGGFPAFITRLKASLNNTSDLNRPTFKEGDYVGGVVIVVDTGKIDEFWRSLKQLAAFFDLRKFSINLKPPPPTNLRGFCGYFKNSAVFSPVTNTFGSPILEALSDFTDSNAKFGVQIEWDDVFICSGYKISRSVIPGGETKFVPYVPESLLDDLETGDPGLITLGLQKIQQIYNHTPVVLPEKKQKVYADPKFNKGQPVVIKKQMGKQRYVDYDVDKDMVGQLYYVIQSCADDGTQAGEYSQELAVTIKTCNDQYNLSEIIEQPNGSFEFFSAGYGNVNSWSSIQFGTVIPWYKDFVQIVDKLVKRLESATKTTSNAFQDFLNSIATKVQTMLDMVSVLAYIIITMKNFVLSPSTLMLVLDPEEGGMNNFVKRIQDADLPPGDPGFSGPEGFTAGLVITYGSSAPVKLLTDFFRRIF